MNKWENDDSDILRALYSGYKKIRAFLSPYLPVNLFKACVRYFLTNFYYSLMIVLQKLWNMFFISSKKLFSFSRYSSFCISIFPSFSPCQPLLQSLIQDKSSSLHVISCLNMNLKNILFDNLRMKKGMTLKLYPSIEYLK